MSGGESHLESTESVADERERITVKPRKQNAGEGGNLRGRGRTLRDAFVITTREASNFADGSLVPHNAMCLPPGVHASMN